MRENFKWYKLGLKDGIPIALGYFAVAFTLGIVAKKSGLSAFQALIAAGLTNASAGAYAGFKVIAEDSGFLEMALTQLIINARYLLMACALSQKLSPKASMLHRSLIAFEVTDEIFGISVAVKGKLNPYYNYGAASVAIPCWATGTFLGVIMGNVLPSAVVSALSVGLYGMFLAIVIPPAKENKILSSLVIISMIASFLFPKISFLSGISEGMKIIVLTVVISLFAALIFPLEEDDEYDE